MDARDLNVGEIVQIDPTHDNRFGACLMVVTEPKHWGAQGFVQVPGIDGGRAYYRCEFKNMEPTGGAAEWMPSDECIQAED